MRTTCGLRLRALVAVTTLAMLLCGCTVEVTGRPLRDPTPVPLALSDDGFGIVAGFEDAPARIEIFTEPQCPHCARLQSEFGDELGYYIGLGALQVTYRPLTFLDRYNPAGHSARVSNALFQAAEGDGTGTEFQKFVQLLWANQEPDGPGPSNAEMAELAREAGLPRDVAERIGDGDSAVDIDEMDAYNSDYLIEVTSRSPATPTVYDSVDDTILDVSDDDWLRRLLRSWRRY
ncbi:MAG: thioredoxin domain-containing protein [Mycolicibacterium hassiacum]|jgi:hypothetical protein